MRKEKQKFIIFVHSSRHLLVTIQKVFNGIIYVIIIFKVQRHTVNGINQQKYDFESISMYQLPNIIALNSCVARIANNR